MASSNLPQSMRRNSLVCTLSCNIEMRTWFGIGKHSRFCWSRCNEPNPLHLVAIITSLGSKKEEIHIKALEEGKTISIANEQIKRG